MEQNKKHLTLKDFDIRFDPNDNTLLSSKVSDNNGNVNLFRFIKDLFFKSKDAGITNNLIDKSLFIKDPKKLVQENNKEIQTLTEDVDMLKKEFKIMNEKLNYIIEELGSRG